MDTQEDKKTKIKSKEYPAITLDQAIVFIKKLKDYPIGKPISYDAAAKEMNVKPTTKSFTYTVSSARQYGLISTSTGKTLSFLEPANRLARPTENEQTLTLLKIQCFSSPKLYSELIEEYNGKSMPATNVLENVLVSYYGVAPKAAKTAAQTFIDTANEVGAVNSGVLNTESNANNTDATTAGSPEENSKESEPGDQPPQTDLNTKDGFGAPLSIPFGDHRKAILYMPLDATADDADYVLEMIKLMFKKVYGVQQ